MPNLGTKAGTLMPSGGLLAGDPNTTGAQISEYGKYYGSYSGADIKVSVHYPIDPRREKNVLRQKAELEARLSTIANEFSAVSSPTAAQIASHERQVAALQAEIVNLSSASTTANGTATQTLGEIQSISWSVFREKSPVRCLGATYARSYCRGSRCIPETENVYVKDKGLISIADVRLGDYIQSSGFEYNKVLGSFKQGYKDCYMLKLANGYSLRASFDHPVYTSRGWIEMQDLNPGDEVHTCGSTPVHNQEYDISDELLKMIGYLIGDGKTQIYTYGSKTNHSISLSINSDEMCTIGKESKECLDALNIGFNDKPKTDENGTDRNIHVCEKGKGMVGWQSRVYNKLHKTLKQYNLYGKYSHQKEIPQEFMHGLSERQIILFLKRLFSTDGGYSISHDDKKKYIDFFYSSTSEKLIDQIRVLLNKLGINCIKSKEKKAGTVGGRPNIISRHDVYRLTISDALELIRFVWRVGVFGKDDRIAPYQELLLSRIKYHFLDVDPKVFWTKAMDAMKDMNISLSGMKGKHNIYNYNVKITPKKAIIMRELINHEEFTIFVNKIIDELINKRYDLIPRKVLSLEHIGTLPVYDLEVEDRHCFICNGIKVHNSIAGTMIFTIFHEHVFHEIMRLNLRQYNTGTSDFDRYTYTTMLIDQLPPLDFSLIFANEYGAISHMQLYGVEFFQEGGTFSIEDLFSENVVQYIARDIDPMRIVEKREIDGHGITEDWQTTASDLLRGNTAIRRNPFI